MASKDSDQPNYYLTPTELANVVGKSLSAINKTIDTSRNVKLDGKRTGVPRDTVQEYLEKAGADYDFRVVAHLNLRGGIGKTTASISLASRAYQYGHKVAIIDLDSQASASLAFNVANTEEDDDNLIFADVWDSVKEVKDALVEISPGFSILPSSLDNGLLDSLLSNPKSQRDAVSNLCQELERLGFTMVVIDCPPSLGAAVVSTICAADTMVIPVDGDSFSRRGVDLTINEIGKICDTFKLDEPDVRILFSRYDGRTKICMDTISELSKNETTRPLLLPCFIRTSAELSKAAKDHKTIFASLRKSTAREDYDIYARHILGLDSLGSGAKG